MSDSIRKALAGQLEAALAMLNDCIALCPPEHWDGKVAKYPFWHVAYHALCFVDCYLSPSEEAFRRSVESRLADAASGADAAPNFHPRGMQELDDEYPSRRFEQPELLAYAAFCRRKIHEVLGDSPAAETSAALDGPSGFPWLPFTRAETHIYNARHVQHHAGQLGAFLRRVGVQPGWVKRGWR